MSPELLLSILLAATPIRLEQVRQESRDSTPARQAELERVRAVAGEKLARAAIAPQLVLSADAGRTVAGTQTVMMSMPAGKGGYLELLTNPEGMRFEDRAVDMEGYSRNSYGLRLTLTQLLYDGGRWWKEIARAGAQADAAAGQAEEQRHAAELEGVRRFYELYRAQETVRLLAATVQRSEEQLERARQLFAAGRAGLVEQIAAEVNLGNDQIALVGQRAVVAAAQADLAVFLARPGDEELEALAPEELAGPPGPVPELADALAAARRQRPLLRAIERQLEAARLGVELAGSAYQPQVLLQGGYSRQGELIDPVFTDPRRQNVLTGGLTVRWDLFTGFSTAAEVEQAQAAQSSAELELRQGERELEALVRTSLAVLAARREEWTVAAANLAVARRGLALAEERFQAGAGSTLEVRDAALKVVQAELAALGSRIDAEIGRAALQRATGGPIAEGGR